jgi:hypothetical protein
MAAPPNTYTSATTPRLASRSPRRWKASAIACRSRSTPPSLTRPPTPGRYKGPSATKRCRRTGHGIDPRRWSVKGNQNRRNDRPSIRSRQVVTRREVLRQAPRKTSRCSSSVGGGSSRSSDWRESTDSQAVLLQELGDKTPPQLISIASHQCAQPSHSHGLVSRHPSVHATKVIHSARQRGR